MLISTAYVVMSHPSKKNIRSVGRRHKTITVKTIEYYIIYHTSGLERNEVSNKSLMFPVNTWE